MRDVCVYNVMCPVLSAGQRVGALWDGLVCDYVVCIAYGKGISCTNLLQVEGYQIKVVVA